MRLCAVDEKAGSQRKVSNCAMFNRHELRASVDSNKIKQVFWNLCDTRLRGYVPEGEHSPGLEQRPFWLNIAFSDHRRWTSTKAACQDL